MRWLRVVRVALAHRDQSKIVAEALQELRRDLDATSTALAELSQTLRVDRQDNLTDYEAFLDEQLDALAAQLGIEYNC